MSVAPRNGQILYIALVETCEVSHTLQLCRGCWWAGPVWLLLLVPFVPSHTPAHRSRIRFPFVLLIASFFFLRLLLRRAAPPHRWPRNGRLLLLLPPLFHRDLLLIRLFHRDLLLFFQISFSCCSGCFFGTSFCSGCFDFALIRRFDGRGRLVFNPLLRYTVALSVC